MAEKQQLSFDDLRRARGEGWQWAKAATDACPQCGFHSGALPPEALGAQLIELADAWRSFLVSADDDYLRTSPGPGIFSPIQYGAHVRDIQRVYGDRILLALEHDSPTVPQFNPDDDQWGRYNELPAGELAADLEAQARRLAALFGDLDEAQRLRTVTRDGGRDGVYSFTLTGLMSYAVHESHHHLLDAQGTIAAS